MFLLSSRLLSLLTSLPSFSHTTVLSHLPFYLFHSQMLSLSFMLTPGFSVFHWRPNFFAPFLRPHLLLLSALVAGQVSRGGLSHQSTFAALTTIGQQVDKLTETAQVVADHLHDESLCARHLTVYIKDTEFRVYSKACMLPAAVQTVEAVGKAAMPLLLALQRQETKPIRQLGIRASNFYAEVSASDADQPTLKSFVQTSQPTHKSSKTNQPVSCPAARDKESHSWSCQACNYLHENREIDLMHCAVCGLIRNDQQQVSSLLAVVHKLQGLSRQRLGTTAEETGAVG